nr:nickel-dependent lactate racemase [Desulfobacterales bacterium]
MVKIKFPYKDIDSIEIPDENLAGVYEPEEIPISRSEDVLIRDSFCNPIGTPQIKDMVREGEKILILSDDNTRPTPVKKILPHLLKELHIGGIRDKDIKIIIALGTHRPMSKEELVAKLGQEMVDRFPVVNHRWEDKSQLNFIGKTSLGVEIWINKAIEEADFIIGIGSIMPLMASGFSGGGKIIVPGICGEKTNDQMHWAGVNLGEEELLGKRDNPVREVIDQVSRQAGLNVIINAVVDSRGRIVDVVVGDLEEAHCRGCRIAKKVHGVQIPERTDIVVADSYPFDIEFWQANKALDTAGLVVKEGGVIILVSPCYEGISKSHPEIPNYGYQRVVKIKELVEKKEISPTVGVHMIQVSRVAVERAKCILVSEGISKEDKFKLGLLHARTPQEALKEAFRMKGKQAKVSVLRGAAEMLPLLS